MPYDIYLYLRDFSPQSSIDGADEDQNDGAGLESQVVRDEESVPQPVPTGNGAPSVVSGTSTEDSNNRATTVAETARKVCYHYEIVSITV